MFLLSEIKECYLKSTYTARYIKYEVKMKRAKYAVVGILMLFVASTVLAADLKSEISVDEAMKYYCITWVNPDYNDKANFPAKITNNTQMLS